MSKKKNDQPNFFTQWFEKIDTTRRVKAVCKPCWEIKYCPYGPLVEQFPHADEEDERRCRIFGHQCPVFHIAEPFTETKVLRNISRSISRPTQFRVLKRENQVCRKCNQPVADDDIQFDHIIPWSKGGPSDEHNVQLLCGKCNRKKSDKFESENLIDSFTDHMVEPEDHSILEFVMCLADFAHAFNHNEGRFPVAVDIAECMNDGKLGAPEERGGVVIDDLQAFFSGPRPKELSATVFKALKDRWGFIEGEIYTLKSTSAYYEMDVNDFLQSELSLINRLGWRVALNPTSRRKWLAS